MLSNALAVLLLMDELEDPAFERAAVRWIARFAGECARVGLGEVQPALEALDALPAEDAARTLRSLLARHAKGQSSAGGDFPRGRPQPS